MNNENLNFGDAIAALKEGKRAARSGWNGKSMFVFMRPADDLAADFIPKVKSLPDSVKTFLNNRADVEARHRGLPLSEFKIHFSAYLCMYAADRSIVNGWLASQTDMLAEDWTILD